MSLQVFGENDDIIEIYQADLETEASHNQIHHSGEGGGGVTHSKGEDAKLETSPTGDERGLMAVGRMYRHLVVTRSEVKSAEPLSTGQRVEAFAYEWKRVGILPGFCVNSSVVYAKSRCPILLPHDDHVARPFAG